MTLRDNQPLRDIDSTTLININSDDTIVSVKLHKHRGIVMLTLMLVFAMLSTTVLLVGGNINLPIGTLATASLKPNTNSVNTRVLDDINASYDIPTEILEYNNVLEEDLQPSALTKGVTRIAMSGYKEDYVTSNISSVAQPGDIIIQFDGLAIGNRFIWTRCYGSRSIT
ncbi:MAG: hypothetical protein LBK70_02290 [Clostridiales bacterium]|jgi:hypothetical protein|nr:hypothetical protein [Clostridiales bacterium]